MPMYDYLCKTCLAAANEIKGSPLTEDEQEEVMFETKHAMSPTAEELERTTACPRCDGHDTVKTYHGVTLATYVRGYGYLDRAGCNRDMNLYKMCNDDPYGHMRQVGEAEDLRTRLRRGGKHQPKTQYFPVNDARAAAAVKDVKQIG